MKSIYRNLLRIVILAAFVFCAFNFSTVKETAAVSSSATM